MATQVESIKWLPGPCDRRFLVDGFAFATPACRHYFLTHFHSDHTVGLTKRFSYGTVYTSEITARLLVHDMGLPPHVVRPLPMHTPVEVEGVRVTLLDANHCPGAVMLLLEVPPKQEGGRGEVILHTGDCRWQPWMLHQAHLPSLKVDTLYLDTTYCLPRYTFPTQEEVIEKLAQAVARELSSEPDTLVVMAAYHIGKERAFLGVARRLGIKVLVSPSKLRVLRLLGLQQEELDMLTADPQGAGMHVVHWGLRPQSLEKLLGPEQQQEGLAAAAAACSSAEPWAAAAAVATSAAACQCAEAAAAPPPDWLVEEPGGCDDGGGGDGGGMCADVEEQAVLAAGARWKRVVGIRATGWTFSKRRDGGGLAVWRQGRVTMIGAPYSEHSSFADLRACVGALRPRRLVPTVNAATPAAARALVDRFAHLMDLSGDRSRLDAYLMKPTARVTVPPVPPPAAATAAVGAEASGDLSIAAAVAPVASAGGTQQRQENQQQLAGPRCGRVDGAGGGAKQQQQQQQGASVVVETIDMWECSGVDDEGAEGDGSNGDLMNGAECNMTDLMGDHSDHDADDGGTGGAEPLESPLMAGSYKGRVCHAAPGAAVAGAGMAGAAAVAGAGMAGAAAVAGAGMAGAAAASGSWAADARGGLLSSGCSHEQQPHQHEHQQQEGCLAGASQQPKHQVAAAAGTSERRVQRQQSAAAAAPASDADAWVDLCAISVQEQQRILDSIYRERARSGSVGALAAAAPAAAAAAPASAAAAAAARDVRSPAASGRSSGFSAGGSDARPGKRRRSNSDGGVAGGAANGGGDASRKSSDANRYGVGSSNGSNSNNGKGGGRQQASIRSFFRAGAQAGAGAGAASSGGAAASAAP